MKDAEIKSWIFTNLYLYDPEHATVTHIINLTLNIDKSHQIKKYASGEQTIISSSLNRHLKPPYVHAGLVSLILFLTFFYFNWNIHSNEIEQSTSLGHEWMPNLFTICDKYGDQGLELVDIRLGGRGIDSQVKLDERIAEVKSPFWDDRDHPISIALGLWKRPPFLWTEEEQKANGHLPCALLRDYGFGAPISLPKGVLINREGRVVGEFDLRSESDNALLEKLLQEK